MSEDSPPTIIFSIEIEENFAVECYVNFTRVPAFKNTFQKRLIRYSQLDCMIELMLNATRDLKPEVKKIVNDLKSLA